MATQNESFTAGVGSQARLRCCGRIRSGHSIFPQQAAGQNAHGHRNEERVSHGQFLLGAEMLASSSRARLDPGAFSFVESSKYRSAAARSPVLKAISPAWRSILASRIPKASAAAICVRASVLRPFT